MRTWVLVLCLLALTVAVVGQSNYALVTGTVKDAQSLPVAKASVQFKALSTGATRVVVTSDVPS